MAIKAFCLNSSEDKRHKVRNEHFAASKLSRKGNEEYNMIKPSYIIYKYITTSK